MIAAANSRPREARPTTGGTISGRGTTAAGGILAMIWWTTGGTTSGPGTAAPRKPRAIQRIAGGTTGGPETVVLRKPKAIQLVTGGTSGVIDGSTIHSSRTTPRIHRHRLLRPRRTGHRGRQRLLSRAHRQDRQRLLSQVRHRNHPRLQSQVLRHQMSRRVETWQASLRTSSIRRELSRGWNR